MTLAGLGEPRPGRFPRSREAGILQAAVLRASACSASLVCRARWAGHITGSKSLLVARPLSGGGLVSSAKPQISPHALPEISQGGSLMGTGSSLVQRPLWGGGGGRLGDPVNDRKCTKMSSRPHTCSPDRQWGFQKHMCGVGMNEGFQRAGSSAIRMETGHPAPPPRPGEGLVQTASTLEGVLAIISRDQDGDGSSEGGG